MRSPFIIVLQYDSPFAAYLLSSAMKTHLHLLRKLTLAVALMFPLIVIAGILF